jgi:hypothetical protein
MPISKVLSYKVGLSFSQHSNGSVFAIIIRIKRVKE